MVVPSTNQCSGNVWFYVISHHLHAGLAGLICWKTNLELKQCLHEKVPITNTLVSVTLKNNCSASQFPGVQMPAFSSKVNQSEEKRSTESCLSPAGSTLGTRSKRSSTSLCSFGSCHLVQIICRHCLATKSCMCVVGAVVEEGMWKITGLDNLLKNSKEAGKLVEVDLIMLIFVINNHLGLTGRDWNVMQHETD